MSEEELSLESCELCPKLCANRKRLGSRPVVATDNETARVLLLAGNPSIEDSSRGHDWRSGDWPIVNRALKSATLPRKHVAVTFATRCPANGSKEITREYVDNCRPWLQTESDWYPEVKVIVALGKHACASVLNVAPGSVYKHRGKIHEVEYGGRKVLVILSRHPVEAKLNPFNYEALKMDLWQAKKLSAPGHELFQMDKFQESHSSTYKLVTGDTEMREMVDTLLDSPLVAFDIESRGVDPFHLPEYTPPADDPEALPPWAEQPRFVTSIQFCPEPDHAYFVPVEHKDHNASAAMRDEVRRFFRDYTGTLVAHNGKFDQVGILRDFGVLPRLGLDTMACDQLARGMAGRSLKKLAWEFTPFGGYEEHMSDNAPDGHKHDSWYYDLETLFWYGCIDVDATWRIAHHFVFKLLDNDRDATFMSEFISKASGVLARIEVGGWRVDQEYLREYGLSQEKVIEETKSRALDTIAEPIEIYERQAGEGSFKLTSTKALASLLYDVIGIECKVLTPKKAPSTSRAALEAIRGSHEIVEHVLEMRAALKAHTAFYKRWTSGMVNGRLHYRYNLIKYKDVDTGDSGGTATGRLSSSGAAGNVQQVPKDSVIRRVFLPDDDLSVILDIDFSTLEYVIAAIYSEDPILCAAFKNGFDVHAAVAAEVFGKTIEFILNTEEGKMLRRRAKTLNFAIVYGAGAQNVAQQLDVTVEEAEEFLATYREKFPALFSWIDRTHAQLRETGISRSKFGRIRYLPDACLSGRSSRNAALVQAALRRGINTPIQADASDLCLWGLVNIQQWLDDSGLRTRILATIHDAVVLSVPKEELEEVYSKVCEILTNPGLDWLDGPNGLGVPLRVGAEIGQTWGEMEAL